MENEKNNNGIKIITGILAVLLVVAGAFAVKLYNQEKDTKAELTKEKNLVIANLREMNDKYDVVIEENNLKDTELNEACLLYTSPSPRDLSTSRMPSSA